LFDGGLLEGFAYYTSTSYAVKQEL